MNKQKEVVVILHGILRRSTSMWVLERHFKKAGYDVLNLTYPSTSKTIEQIANGLAEKLKHIPNGTKINFVTHSMGGLVLRAYLNTHKVENLGKIVMLAPPNHGSEMADFLKKIPVIKNIFNWLYGPAGQQLGTNKDKSSFTAKNKPVVDFNLGIIAGNSDINFIGKHIIGEPSDGTVAVRSTKIDGCNNHIIINANHTFIMYYNEAIKQTLHFILHGKFKK